MKSFLCALQFLTIIPVKIKIFDDKEYIKSLIYFPIIGFLLGIILLILNDILIILNFEKLTINVILVISLIILTGGLHLDGLSDTFDALLSRKPKEKMLEIMRDSHVGVMGVLSIISIILLKISFLYSINPSLKNYSLLLSGLLSRWSMIFSMFLFPYARTEGKAKFFSENINNKIFLSATIITLLFTYITWQLKGIIILGIIGLSTYFFNKQIKNKLEGITGDTIGATNEIMEAIVLLSFLIIEKVILK